MPFFKYIYTVYADHGCYLLLALLLICKEKTFAKRNFFYHIYELDVIVSFPPFVFHREDLPSLKYMSMFLKEVMRMHSPVPFISRITSKPLTLDGVTIPANTKIDILIHAINHHPDIWPDNRVLKYHTWISIYVLWRPCYVVY